MRALAKRQDVLASASTLWRALAVYRLSRYWTRLAEVQHLRLSHVYAVLKLPRARQATLLGQAEKERWSVAQLRSAARSPQTRSPESVEPILRALQAICGLQTGAQPPPDSVRRDQMKRLLASARKVLSSLDDWLE